MSLFQHFNLNHEDMKESLIQSDMNAVMKSALVLILEDYMEKERDDFIQAQKYERAEERTDYRNGYQAPRELIMSLGKIQLRVPRTRSGEFSTDLFEKYARVDQAFMLSMMEMVVNGVSTRKVTHIIETLCGETVSKSYVSTLAEKLDPIVREWAGRPLQVQRYLYLFLDAMYIKVREHGRVVSKAVYIATAITARGQREVVGLLVSEQESYAGWKFFLQSLKQRGLTSPQLVVSDAHAGLKQAIQTEFLGTSWQRCTVHFKRNLLQSVPKKEAKPFMQDIRMLYKAENLEYAQAQRDFIFDKYKKKPRFEKALRILEEGFEDSVQYFSHPVAYRSFLTSTNHLERLNQEVRRRERVIRIFPNETSAFRLLGAVLMQYDEEQRKKRLICIAEE